MVSMDIFTQDAFKMQSLTAGIQDVETVPSFLGSLNIFEPVPIRTEQIAIEKRGDSLALVPTTNRGEPETGTNRDRRTLRDFRTVRLSKRDRIQASELQNIRAFGSEDVLKAVQTEIAERQRKLIRDIELTWENHRLGAINGIVLDADGTTEIENYFTKFGVSQPAEIAFDWANKTGVKSFIAQQVIRPVQRACGGRWLPSSRVVALCGDSFFDELQENAEYRATYLNVQGQDELRKDNSFMSLRAWNIDWVNYRGTDDNSTVSVGTTKCKFIPVGVPDAFQVAYSPGESLAHVNTLGMPMYSEIAPDLKRDRHADLYVSSYPLFICTTPEALLRGKEGV